MAWGNRGGGNYGGGQRGGGGGSRWGGGNRGGGGFRGRQGGGQRSNSPLIRVTGLFAGSKDGVFSGGVSTADLGEFTAMLKAQYEAGGEGGVRFVLYYNDRNEGGNGPAFTLMAVGMAEGAGAPPAQQQPQAPQQQNWAPPPQPAGPPIAGPDQGIQPQGGRGNTPLF